jgi:ribosomal protein S3
MVKRIEQICSDGKIVSFPRKQDAFGERHKTAYGIIGIKVWIFKGEILEHDPQARDRRQTELQEGGGMRPQRAR